MGDLERPAMAEVVRRAEAARARQAPRGMPAIPDEEKQEARRQVLLTQWAQRVPAKFVNARVTDFEDRVRLELERWQEAQIDGVSLVLTGPVGVGKSYAAVAAVRPIFAKGCSLLFVPATRLLDMVAYSNPDATVNRRQLETVDLLILDDLGTQRDNEWAIEQVYGVVNERWLEDRPTVVTSNLTPADLEEAIGERTYSRLADAGIGVRLSGEDRRRSKG